MDFKKITSLDNELIKKFLKLKFKKYRRKFNLFFVENSKIIIDAYNYGVFPKYLLFTEEFYNKNKKQIDLLLNEDKSVNVYIINKKINNTISDLDTPSEIIAVYEIQDKKISFSSNILYLNAISDPGNLGTILRSALAFGFKDIVLDEYCTDLYNYKVINAAKETIFKLNIQYDKDLRLLDKIKNDYQLVITIKKDGVDINNISRKELICLVFGNESHGVSDEIKNKADVFLSISTSEEIESLNVASAASIILYSLL